MNEQPIYQFDCYSCKHNKSRHKHEICCEILMSGERGIIQAQDGNIVCAQEEH